MIRATKRLGRRRVLGLLAAAAPTLLLAGQAGADDKPAAMDAIAAIKTRRSVRAYTAEPVTDAKVGEILRCGMQAPSACNEQPWQFVVVRDKETLGKDSGINPYAAYAKNAPVAILVADDLSLEKCGGYWIEDTSACAENMLLAAHALGLGAVWTGIFPLPERVAAFRALLKMPETVTPMALLVMGYPAEHPAPKDRFLPERIHREKW